MEARYFDDWKVGDRIETLGRTVGDSEISQFVALGGFFEELSAVNTSRSDRSIPSALRRVR